MRRNLAQFLVVVRMRAAKQVKSVKTRLVCEASFVFLTSVPHQDENFERQEFFSQVFWFCVACDG